MDKEIAAEPQAAAEAGSKTTSADQQNEQSSINAYNGIADSSNTIPIHENSSATSTDDNAPAVAEKTGPPPAEPEATRTRLQNVIIMTCLCCSVFLAALDTTIITTALPTISEHFHSNAGYTWIGSAYLLANAASTPSWGKFSDIWGRQPILLIASMIFFIGSLLAAISVNIGMLIVARAIQGIGGGGLIILVNICISDLFSMRNRGMYFAMVGMVWALASAVGPVLGGVFTEKVSWRWCFYINCKSAFHRVLQIANIPLVPITGTVTILLFFFLHLHNPRTPVWDGLKAVDWAGSLAIVGGTLMLLLGLEFGGTSHPWGSATVICLIVFGIVVIGLFALNEWKFARYPVMPPRIFNNTSNIASLGVCFCHGYVFIAGTYYLPLYFQAVIGATPLLSGVYVLPLALSLSFVSGATGVFIKKTGKYLPPIWFGLVFMTLGTGLFIDFGPKADWAKIIIYQIIAGIGVGPNFQAPLIALQSKVHPKDIATATATFGFIRNLSTAISVVIGGVVFSNEMNKKSASLVAALGPQLAGQLSGGSAGASVGIVSNLPPGQKEVARAAFNSSLRTMWIQYVAFGALGVFISLFIGSNILSKEHQVTKTGLAEEEIKRQELQEKKRLSREQQREEKRASKEMLRAEKKAEAGEQVPKEEV
jgi:EmrB/QacA subfamily drug resistance transporter